MDSMSSTGVLVTGRSRIYVTGSERKDTSFGFHEMPAWSIDPVSRELIRNDSSSVTAWKTMSCSRQDGLSLQSDTRSIK